MCSGWCRLVAGLGVQVQGIALAPEVMQYLGQLSALQGLDVHGFEGSVSGYPCRMPSPSLQPLSRCSQLRWLDISHWSGIHVTFAEVMPSVDCCKTTHS